MPVRCGLSPGLPSAAIPREGLLRRLDKGLAKNASLVTGPAGSGKTTLLRAWIASPAKNLVPNERGFLPDTDCAKPLGFPFLQVTAEWQRLQDTQTKPKSFHRSPCYAPSKVPRGLVAGQIVSPHPA